MKILSIGNSFSEDAQRYIHQIAKSSNDDIYCANLYIGGCSLERHYDNIKNNAREYDFQENGESTKTLISIKEALIKETWDIITVQQVSSFSGMIETYRPFITEIIEYIKSFCPNAKIYLHQTWSYEQGSFHGDFKNYDNDTDKMYQKIVETNKKIADEENIDKIIPDGEIINELRKTELFDYKNGGASLCRDTFHMDFIYGSYTLSLVWYKLFSGKSVLNISYLPPNENNDEFFTEKIEAIKQTVENYIK